MTKRSEPSTLLQGKSTALVQTTSTSNLLQPLQTAARLPAPHLPSNSFLTPKPLLALSYTGSTRPQYNQPPLLQTLHTSALLTPHPPKNLALPHQDTFVTPVNSKPVFQSLDVLKSPTERNLTCMPSTTVIDLEQEHTSSPSSRVPTLTKTAHAPLLPTTSFPECGQPNRLPSAVQGSLRAGPLPTVEAAAPPTTTSKLCLLPPVLA